MGMNPPKRDAWPPFKRVRLVLVRREPWTVRPKQGLVVDWRKVGTRWRALVVLVDDDTVRGPDVRMEWIPLDRLIPIPVDPNFQAEPVRR